MKTTITTDFDAGRVEAALTIESAEDAERAVRAIRAAARGLWPDAVADDAPATAAPRTPSDFSKPPKPGSLSARILDEVKRLGTSDAVEIADALDLTTGVAAMTISRLRKGGHIT